MVFEVVQYLCPGRLIFSNKLPVQDFQKSTTKITRLRNYSSSSLGSKSIDHSMSSNGIVIYFRSGMKIH